MEAAAMEAEAVVSPEEKRLIELLGAREHAFTELLKLEALEKKLHEECLKERVLEEALDFFCQEKIPYLEARIKSIYEELIAARKAKEAIFEKLTAVKEAIEADSSRENAVDKESPLPAEVNALAEAVDGNKVKTISATQVFEFLGTQQGQADGETLTLELIGNAQITGLESKDAQGFTLLRIALDRGYFDFAETLIASGADVNSQDNKGRTALHSASSSESLESVRFLLEKGADRSIRTKEGKTAKELVEALSLPQKGFGNAKSGNERAYFEILELFELQQEGISNTIPTALSDGARGGGCC